MFTHTNLRLATPTHIFKWVENDLSVYNFNENICQVCKFNASLSYIIFREKQSYYKRRLAL